MRRTLLVKLRLRSTFVRVQHTSTRESDLTSGTCRASNVAFVTMAISPQNRARSEGVLILSPVSQPIKYEDFYGITSPVKFGEVGLKGVLFVWTMEHYGACL